MDFSAITFQLLANTPSGSQGGGSTTVWMVVLLLFFVVYMFFISRRDKKQKKEEAAMRDSMKVGDEVLTIGEGSEEGSSLHRVYATFGVTYFFDRLFSQYARAYDREG